MTLQVVEHGPNLTRLDTEALEAELMDVVATLLRKHTVAGLVVELAREHLDKAHRLCIQVINIQRIAIVSKEVCTAVVLLHERLVERQHPRLTAIHIGILQGVGMDAYREVCALAICKLGTHAVVGVLVCVVRRIAVSRKVDLQVGHLRGQLSAYLLRYIENNICLTHLAYHLTWARIAMTRVEHHDSFSALLRNISALVCVSNNRHKKRDDKCYYEISHKMFRFTKIITIFAGCCRYATAHNICYKSSDPKHPCRFCRQRRQSYKKLLNFEAYFIKISSIGVAYRGVHSSLFRPYCRKQRQFRYALA